VTTLRGGGSVFNRRKGVSFQPALTNSRVSLRQGPGRSLFKRLQGRYEPIEWASTRSNGSGSIEGRSTISSKRIVFRFQGDDSSSRFSAGECPDGTPQRARLRCGFLPRENPASRPEMTGKAREASAVDMQVRHPSRRVCAGQRSVFIRFLNRVSQVRILPRIQTCAPGTLR
jgi:hypothetical protein